MSKIRDAITAAFISLERACDNHSHEAIGLLTKAYDAALQGERAHRRFGAGFGGYRESAETAAKFFAVKWFLDPGKVTDARAACALRLDCLYSSALRCVLGDDAPLLERLEAVRVIDYSEQIATRD